jgi:hypothetical protein
MNSSNRFIDRAERAAGEAETWADLSNFLFDPAQGLIARAYPTREAREAFVKTEDYRRLRRLVAESIDRHGLSRAGRRRRAAGSSCGCRARSTRRWSARRSPRGSDTMRGDGRR